MQFPLMMIFVLSLLATPAICQETNTNGSDSTAVRNRLIIGTGVSIYLDDIETFKRPAPGDNILCIDMDSRFRPTIFTGALFSFSDKTRWNVLVSLKFAKGEQTFLDGFLLGFGYRIDENVTLTASYDLRLGRELRPSFRRAAASLVKDLKKNKKYSAQFSQYRVNDKGDNLIDNKQFEGFPLRDPRTDKSDKVLGGFSDPFVDSFNSSIHIGVAFARSVDLKGLFPPE